jgi:hypothetical protein
LCIEFFGIAIGSIEFYRNSVNRDPALVGCVPANMSAFLEG